MDCPEQVELDDQVGVHWVFQFDGLRNGCIRLSSNSTCFCFTIVFLVCNLKVFILVLFNVVKRQPKSRHVSPKLIIVKPELAWTRLILHLFSVHDCYQIGKAILTCVDACMGKVHLPEGGSAVDYFLVRNRGLLASFSPLILISLLHTKAFLWFIFDRFEKSDPFV